MRSSTEDASLRRETGAAFYNAARILAGNVEFRLAVVLTIGPGIGGTTPVFGLIHARLFSGPAHARAHNV